MNLPQRIVWRLMSPIIALAIMSVVTPAMPQVICNFEEDVDNWAESDVDDGNSSLSIADDGMREGVHALAIAGKTPTSFGAKYRPWDNWRGLTTLSFDLKIPADAPKDLDLYVYVKDHQYLWYQTAPLHDMATGKRTRDLKAGKWETFSIDISEDSPVWEPGGHEKSWDRVLHYPREFGIRFFSPTTWSGVVLIDNFEAKGTEPPLGPMSNGQPGPGRGTINVSPNSETVKVYQKFELTFDVDRDYDNPFDPGIVDVTGHFETPDGQHIVIPGFFYQPYRRTQTPEGWEKLIPVGAPQWKVRFAADTPGTYKYFVQLNDVTGQYRSRAGNLTVLPDPGNPGRVRISEKDPHYFEFQNGDFFYPTGINMRDGGDHAEMQRGTYDFDHFFELFENSGLNFVRTWMCAWWTGIEWSDKYHSRYDGVGRYSMYNAWRLDYAVELAEQHGIYLELTLNSHGQMRRDKFDEEWTYNPYSVKNGGFIPSPAMFFTSEKAKEMIKRRNRYIVARWGYSPHVMTFDLVNEVDLSEGYNKPEVAQWHAEMSRYIQEVDAFDHLVTSHICLYWGYGTELWDLDDIMYIQSDAYWDRECEIGMNKSWQSRQDYEKPFIFIEYGPQTASLPIPAANWKRDFRVGMWMSNQMPAAAPAQFWYHREWEQYALHEYQQALFAYNYGEDRRGMGLKTLNTTDNYPKPADPRQIKPFCVQAMGNGERTYFYVCQFDNMLYATPDEVPAEHALRDVEITLQGVKPGPCTVEYWDTFTGQVIATVSAVAEGGSLTLALPEFAQDIAAKITSD